MLNVEIHGEVGEGKTTVAALIAHYLQFHGFRVELADNSLPTRDAMKTHIREVLRLGTVGEARVVNIKVTGKNVTP